MKNLLLAVFACVLAAAAFAAVRDAEPPTRDIAGAKDHPIAGRHAGSVIIAQDVIDYDELEFPLTMLKHPRPAVTDSSSNIVSLPDKSKKVAGRRTRTVYLIAGTASPLEVVRNYQTELAGKGGSTLFECRQAECGKGTMAVAPTLNGEEHSIPRYLWDPARLARDSLAGCGQRGNVQDSKVAIIDVPASNTTLAIQSFQFAKARCKAWVGRTIAVVDVVEAKGVEQKMVTVNASEMQRAIVATGRIALYGIYFDSGKAEVKPESAAVLAEIGKLLSTSPSLKLLVVGHTDNNGDFDANMDLSKRRAAAVVAALTSQYKVAASRLKAVGVSFASPVAANDREEGRAKNRRVELVALN